MSLAPVVSPYQPINGLTGLGLNDGGLYIGVDGQDPETNPQQCYWDAAGAIPAAQPIQILGGYPMRLGTPTRLYTASTFSIRVRDATGAQVFYEASAIPGPSSTGGVYGTRADAITASIAPALRTTGLTLLGYYAPGDGGGGFYTYSATAPAQPSFRSADGAYWQLAETKPSLLQFGAKGDGATNDAAALNAAVTWAKSRIGAEIFVPVGRYLINSTITFDRLPYLLLRGAGARIASPAGLAQEVRGSVFINASGGVLFDVVDTASVTDHSYHTSGPVFQDIGVQQLNAGTDIAFRFQTQWSQPRLWRCAVNGGLYGITCAGVGVQPFDVECYDCWFFNCVKGCYFPDTGSSDYLHMKFTNCVWRYNGTAVEAQIGNTFHFDGGLVEANTIGFKLASVVLTELTGGLHFEQQTGQDLWMLVGPSGQAPKLLHAKACSATWWITGGQTVQWQIDDCLMTYIDGVNLQKPGGAVGVWNSLLLNQPADRVVDLGAANIFDGNITVTNAALLVHRRGDRAIAGRTLLHGGVDNGVDALQVSGSGIFSSVLKAMGPGGVQFGMRSWGGVGTFDTGISVDSFSYPSTYAGACALCLVTSLAGAGNSTSSELWLIRFGANGGNIGATKVASDPGGIGAFASFVFGVSGSDTLTVTQAAGNFNNSIAYMLMGGRGGI